jgi:hypothetical protein
MVFRKSSAFLIDAFQVFQNENAENTKSNFQSLAWGDSRVPIRQFLERLSFLWRGHRWDESRPFSSPLALTVRELKTKTRLLDVLIALIENRREKRSASKRESSVVSESELVSLDV